MVNNEAQSKYLQSDVEQGNNLYYQDVIIVTIKGLEIKLVKILTLFTSIDLLCNNLDGPIPNEIETPMKISLFSWLFFIPICSIFLNFGTFVVSGQCLGDQKSLLLQFKKGLKYNNNSSTKLIPSRFDELTNLSYLNLSNAGFAGQIPIAISNLTRTWGIICLTPFFMWQLYTIYLLVQLHESAKTGMRYNRYFHLCRATFGDKIAYWLLLFPIIDLSSGTCVNLTIIGGSTLNMFVQMCEAIGISRPLKTVEWYLVFTCGTVVLSLIPNLNSLARVSLIDAISSVSYCTIQWVVSVKEGRLSNILHDPSVQASTKISRILGVVNAFGFIALPFRGHNLILEIQTTMPSSAKNPSQVPMWKGVKSAYLLIAMCLFPLAIRGYWAYGNVIVLLLNSSSIVI
ncbi:lysine histidine transporter-like 8 [Quercus suber]|uniref:lysine histidine transporter-like 8 n=1 Tax=Quercus suber TaxID=58331 RepID=UPI0032DEF793